MPKIELGPPADLGSLSLVQIAERLERVTSQIEAERVREREARARYKEIADQVEAKIAAIKAEASTLVREQHRRMTSFDGLLGAAGNGVGAAPGARSPGAERRRGPAEAPANIADAIVRIWTLPQFDEPLSTEEIVDALPDVGYESKAAPRSLRSAVNQALAKLSRDGRVQKYRQDGTVIAKNEPRARARKYRAKS
jgi:hypothetical protein